MALGRVVAGHGVREGTDSEREGGPVRLTILERGEGAVRPRSLWSPLVRLQLVCESREEANGLLKQALGSNRDKDNLGGIKERPPVRYRQSARI